MVNLHISIMYMCIFIYIHTSPLTAGSFLRVAVFILSFSRLALINSIATASKVSLTGALASVTGSLGWGLRGTKIRRARPTRIGVVLISVSGVIC